MKQRHVIHVCILLNGVKQDSKWCGSFCVYLCNNLATSYTYKSLSFKICSYS